MLYCFYKLNIKLIKLRYITASITKTLSAAAGFVFLYLAYNNSAADWRLIMKVQRFILGPLSTNCYIIETKNKNAAAIDIGGDYDKIKDYLETNGLKLKKILLTHGHYDHFGGTADAAIDSGAEIFISGNDSHMLTSRMDSLADFISNESFKPITEYKEISEGSEIILDELKFKVIETPGHTKGSVCYLCNDYIFTGDTLFALSMGRTDFPGGNPSEMHNSLLRLAEIKEDLNVCPGHNETTTLSFEKRNNPYLKENPYEDLI